MPRAFDLTTRLASPQPGGAIDCTLSGRPPVRFTHLNRVSISMRRLVPFEALHLKGIAMSCDEIWKLEREKQFPRRIRVSEARAAWMEAEIDEWLITRYAETIGLRGTASERVACPHLYRSR